MPQVRLGGFTQGFTVTITWLNIDSKNAERRKSIQTTSQAWRLHFTVIITWLIVAFYFIFQTSFFLMRFIDKAKGRGDAFPVPKVPKGE